jgi:hypothetical protein
MDLSVKIKSGSDTFWTVKQMANITSNMLFHFSDRTTYNLWKKTKVETLSAVCTNNQNSKTVIKTIIDGGHLGKIIAQK